MRPSEGVRGPGRDIGGWDRQRSHVKGVPGRGKQLERTTLGSFALKLEWGGKREGIQLMRTGRVPFWGTGQTRREGFGKY